MHCPKYERQGTQDTEVYVMGSTPAFADWTIQPNYQSNTGILGKRYQSIANFNQNNLFIIKNWNTNIK